LLELSPTHFEALYEIARDHDPTFSSDSLDHFIASASALEGWAVEVDGKIVGCVTLNNLTPEIDIVIHVFIHSDYRKRWLNRAILKQIFTTCFVDLGCARVTGWGVAGMTDEAMCFQERLGFKYEGTVRSAARIKGELRDVVLVGMTRSDCRWLA
jgi:RimJ/RimL family protein N-acetyltransferase